ncbi:Hypothetical protein A7982_05899 [Minicystis rosea]|nr:Hypothetical protein A7982_05899 [Minicystis rosea]
MGAPDPAAFLARMMDLRGSVELAQRLSILDRPRPAGAPVDPAARARLRAFAVERLDTARDDLARTFADPFVRRYKIPSAEELVTILIDSGALIDRRGRALTTAIDAVWGPCADLISRSLDRVRFELGTLREELVPMLVALGPEAARLERLDAAVLGATAKGRQQLEDRLIAALARSFAARFGAAVGALPGATAPAHVAPWYAPGGFVRAEILRGRDIVVGIFGHERRRIEALVDGGGDPA